MSMKVTQEDEMLSLASCVHDLGETFLDGLCLSWDLLSLTTPGIPHIVFCVSALLAIGSYFVYGEISISKLLDFLRHSIWEAGTYFFDVCDQLHGIQSRMALEAA